MSNQLTKVPTPEQFAAMTTLDRSVCLTAAAGSGKTMVLAGRYFELVRQGLAKPAQILTITFTEKAAAEMKERIRKLFETAGMIASAEQVSYAPISTVHSACANILRVYAPESGLNPAFEILAEGREQRLLVETLDDLFNALYQDEKNEEIKELLIQFGREKLIDIISYLYTKLVTNGLQPDALFIIRTHDLPHLEYLLKENARQLIGWNLKVTDTVAKLKEVAIMLVQLLDAREGDYSWAYAEQVEQYAERITLQHLPNIELKEIVKELKESINEYLQRIYEIRSTRQIRMVQKLFDQFLKVYRQRKQADDLLGFDDLQLQVLTLLETRPEVMIAIQKHYKYILVDEYQDINHLQDRIIEKLRQADNLFIVGDAQQSIYGFREADVELFRQKQNALELQLTLDCNFRSNHSMLVSYNQFLAKILGNQYIPMHAPLKLADQAVSQKETPVELLEYPCEEKAPINELRKKEATAIALYIREQLAGIDWNNQPGVKLRTEDCAVLFRSFSNLLLYEEALRKAGVPYWVAYNKGFYQQREIQDLLQYLRLLVEPNNRLIRYTVMRSPLVGISHEDLLAMNLLSKQVEPAMAVRKIEAQAQISSDGSRRLKQFYQHYEKLTAELDQVPLSQLIENIIRLTGYDGHLSGLFRGEAKLNDLWYLRDMARECRTIHQFLDMITQKEESADREEALDISGANGVKLLTIHRAKGLEFELVILADLENKLKHPIDLPIIWAAGKPLGLKVEHPQKHCRLTPLAFTEIDSKRVEGELEEAGRLFYVACTRARTKLVFALPGRVNKKEEDDDSSYGAWVRSFASLDWPRKVMTGSLPRGRRVGIDPELRAELVERLGEQSVGSSLEVPVIVQPTLQLSVTQLREYAICPKMYYQKHVLKIPEQFCNQYDSKIPDSPPTPSLHSQRGGSVNLDKPSSPLYMNIERGVRGVSPDQGHLGTSGERIHHFLHEVDFDVKPNTLRQILRTQFPSAPAVQSALMNFRQSLLWETIRKKKREGGVVQEWSFTWRYQQSTFDGAIDLAYESAPGHWVVVDFKSHVANGEEANVIYRKERYDLQLLIYKHAFAQIAGQMVDRAYVYFLDSGSTIDLDDSRINQIDELVNHINGRSYPSCGIDCGH